MITMYDSATNSQFPPGAPAYAAYVDGGIGDQPNYAYVAAAFPGARHLSIALSAAHDADCLDVEPYAASPSDVTVWHARQVARGIGRPVIYASVSTMRDAILPLLGHISPKRLWTAHYGAGEHICGPGSCGQLPVDADGTQWTSNALGRDLDQSLLRDGFFGAPAPAWPAGLVLREGDTGPAVRVLQQALRDSGQYGARGLEPIDGIFGPKTLAAVRNFQADKRLTVDGIAGPQTRAALLGGAA